MPVGELIRKNLYWLMDSFKDSSVSSHLEDIDRLLHDRELSDRVNSERLGELLKHACSNTGFYREYRGCMSLHDFPVINKETIKKNPDSFLSKTFNKEKLISRTTSGSYGVPMQFYLSSDKNARRTAEVIYFARWAAYEVGIKHAYVIDGGRSRLKAFMQNQVTFDSSILSEKWFEFQRQRIKNNGIQYIVGYASAVTALSEYIKSCGDTSDMYGVRGVMVISEPFSEDMRNTVSTAFNCPVIARYSAEELGVLACECPEEHKYHINNASYIIELLNLNNDREVMPGQVGRVVVTDLFSYAMPLIRYDIGDLAVLAEGQNCGRSPLAFERLDGRIAALIYNTSGEPIHFASIDNRIWDMQKVLMYQFIQQDKKKYVVRIVPMTGYNRRQEGLYSRRLKEILGREADISFESVNEIPPLNSGKRPLYLSNYRAYG